MNEFALCDKCNPVTQLGVDGLPSEEAVLCACCETNLRCYKELRRRLDSLREERLSLKSKIHEQDKEIVKLEKESNKQTKPTKLPRIRIKEPPQNRISDSVLIYLIETLANSTKQTRDESEIMKSEMLDMFNQHTS